LSRRNARELALQVLFHIDVGRSDPETALKEAFDREEEAGVAGRLAESDAAYARELVVGTWTHRDEIDSLIATYAKDWSVDRMVGVDRNIMRIAIYEVRHRADVPDGVAADEAVELSKLFSTNESGKFINGILGSVIRGLKSDSPAAGDVKRNPGAEA
jgi:N utilization substance protein B